MFTFLTSSWGGHPQAAGPPQVTTVFVGGLRKSTTEDKVAGHFAKYGQAWHVIDMNSEMVQVWLKAVYGTLPAKKS